jgi:predicted DsbA family dithiol-disulfide isomerase
VSGRPLEDLFAGRPVNLDEMRRRLCEAARGEGLPFADRTMTYNSRLAQELGKWAESQGQGDAFHHAAFAAYFADGANIALVDVLVGVAEGAGLSADEARQMIEDRRFRTEVDRDWERSRRLGITAVPTFMIGGSRLVGAQPCQALERFVAGAGAVKKEQK